MNKKHVLKASFAEYIKYYKNLKLGLQQACLFLRDLEPKIEKLAQNKETEHRYYNPDTKKELFFLAQDVFEIRNKIEILALEYYIMKPELLRLEEYDEFEYDMLRGLYYFNISIYDDLNFVLSFRSEDDDKKLDILARILILAAEYWYIDYEQFLRLYGNYIVDFCILRNTLSEVQKNSISSRFNINSVFELKEKVILHQELARPIIEHLFSMYPKKFFFIKNRIEKNYISFENHDCSKRIKFPKIFSLEKSKSYYIDMEKFFFFLQDLDDYRIRFNLKKLNKIFKVWYLDQFEQMCIRFRAPEVFHKIKVYFCNYLRKTLITSEELKLNYRFSKYTGEITKFVKQIHLARLNLHNRLFKYYVVSCFSSIELEKDEDDYFFSKAWGYNFFKKKRKIRKMVEVKKENN